MHENLTLGATVADAIALAGTEASQQGAAAVAPEHLLCALVIVAAEDVAGLLGAPVDVAAITDRSHGLTGMRGTADGPIPLAHGTLAVVESALREAADGDGEVLVEHLLLGLLEAAPDACAHVLFDAAATRRSVRRNAAAARGRLRD